MAVPAAKNPPSPKLRLVSEIPPDAGAPLASQVVARRPAEDLGESAGDSSGRTDAQQHEAPTSGDELSDAQLVALARVGERKAFERLYRRHAPYVLALAVRMQGNAADAEDIVHDAFMKVSSRLEELRNGDSFRFWLAKVAANLVRSRLRKRRLLGALGLTDAEPIDLDLLVTPEAGPEHRVQLAQVYESLAEVTVEQRLAWVLRFVEGYKLEEVAELRGCSLATAKRWIATAQERISAGVVKGGAA